MSNNYCAAPLIFEANNQRNRNNDFIDMTSNTNLNYSELANESVKPAIYMGDGWCTFPDLDNFDSEKLLRAFTLKEKDSADSIWDPTLGYTDSCQRSNPSLSVSALRQLEALFNLSQLLFGLSRAETVNYTFRDLQLRRHPHSFKKSGFKQLNTEGRIDFYSIFEKLVNDIIDAGGLEVTLLIYKNPMLPMVRQKCLDLISNVATVPDVAYKIMRHQMWFLDHLLILVRDGEIVSDKIPALSVLIRLLKVMLTERLISAYMKLVDMQYIDCLVDIFDNPSYTVTEFLPFFIKFEFITMQSLTVILGDAEYSQLWSDKAKTRLLNYCMIVLLKASGAYPNVINNDQVEQINHIFYAEQHTNKHSLAHTIMTVTELLRNDENMKIFYRYHRPFKQLIIQLYKKYGAKSLYIRSDPGISYALNHLMRVLYIKNTVPTTNSSSSSNPTNSGSLTKNSKQQSEKNLAKMKKSSDLDPRVEQPRTCSNPVCKNEETKYKPFKPCSNCDGAAAYCSSKCKKAHISHHLKNECQRDDLARENPQPIVTHTYNRIYSSTSTGNYQKNSTNRRASENLQHKNYQENIELQQQQPPPLQVVNNTNKRRESSAGQDLFYQFTTTTTTTKKLSKFASMNENNRRNSVVSNVANYQELENVFPKTNETSNLNRINPFTKNVYTKRSSMKESKSGIANPFKRFSAFEDISKSKTAKQLITMDDTAGSVQFVRPLKTSTAVCLIDLSRRQSLREVKKESQSIVNKFNTEPVALKNSDSSSHASSLSSDSASVSSGKNPSTIKKLKTSSESLKQNEVIKRPKKVEIENENNFLDGSVHKRRHSATAAILLSAGKATKLVDDSGKTSKGPFPTNDSLFYHGKQDHQLNKISNNELANNLSNHTKSSSLSSKSKSNKRSDEKNHTSDDNEEFPSSSSANSSNDDVKQVKVQKYQLIDGEPNEDDDDEVENERRALTNDQNLGCSNERIESKIHSDIQKDIQANELYAYSISHINEDEQDIRSHFKVVKEFEKTLEFVKNASNLKVMPSLSLNQNNDEESGVYNKRINGLRAPHISLASLCYDTQKNRNTEEDKDGENDDDEDDDEDVNSDSNESEDNTDDSDEDEDNKNEELKQANNQMNNMGKRINFIINNSIDSHMLTNSYNTNREQMLMNDNNRKSNENPKKLSYHDIKQKSIKRDVQQKNPTETKTHINRAISNNHLADKDQEVEFVDDELSLFRNETLLTSKFSDYKDFKKPLMNSGNETKSASSLHSTKMSEYQRQPSIEIKKPGQVFVQKHTELKVFNNLSVNVTQNENTKTSTVTLTGVSDLPKNSTPIFTDNIALANLNAKNRQFLNAKLNLTIMPSQQQMAQNIEPKKLNINSSTSTNNVKSEAKSVFLVPQVPPIQEGTEQQLKPKQSPTYKTSTLKSNSNLIMDAVDMNHGYSGEMSRKLAHKLMPSDILDVSKISALENATSTNSCVVVTKADMPRDIKKCLKDEIKKDKSKCSIM